LRPSVDIDTSLDLPQDDNGDHIAVYEVQSCPLDETLLYNTAVQGLTHEAPFGGDSQSQRIMSQKWVALKQREVTIRLNSSMSWIWISFVHRKTFGCDSPHIRFMMSTKSTTQWILYVARNSRFVHAARQSLSSVSNHSVVSDRACSRSPHDRSSFGFLLYHCNGRSAFWQFQLSHNRMFSKVRVKTKDVNCQ
jgi:hypothetical protein